MGIEYLDRLVKLGNELSKSEKIKNAVQKAHLKNPWFTPEYIRLAIESICSEMLNETKLSNWLQSIKFSCAGKTVGLVFAGNIPLVGFHDFLCAYVTGFYIQIKLSSKDEELFPTLLEILSEIDPDCKKRVKVVQKLDGFDAVIATGSDNTNRYFEYYFRDYPNLLRKNRTSIAILTGEETDDDLENLADDMLTYFGFGCRNVSKLYLRKGFDLPRIFKAVERHYKWMYDHTKFMNNYDYQRTILLLNKAPHFANEFIMLVPNTSLHPPIGTVYYQEWSDIDELKQEISSIESQIQCIVSSKDLNWKEFDQVTYGKTQCPSLQDYADRVDTLDFLKSVCSPKRC